MSKIAEQLVAKIWEWSGDNADPDRLEQVLDRALEGKTIQRKELENISKKKEYWFQEWRKAVHKVWRGEDQIREVRGQLWDAEQEIHDWKEQRAKDAARIDELEGIATNQLSEIESLKDQVDRKDVQLAGVCTAASGWATEKLSVDAYGWSVPYQDTIELRQKYEAAADKVVDLDIRNQELGKLALETGDKLFAERWTNAWVIAGLKLEAVRRNADYRHLISSYTDACIQLKKANDTLAIDVRFAKAQAERIQQLNAQVDALAKVVAGYVSRDILAWLEPAEEIQLPRCLKPLDALKFNDQIVTGSTTYTSK